MKILALESSAKAASAAVCMDGKLLVQYYQNSGLTHSKTLLAMAEDMLKNLDMKIDDIDIFAVANGPGSFTGIRIGTAAVKGLAWASGKPACAVSTLEAMAYGAAWHDGIVCPVMDARRGQIYNAKFLVDGGKVTRIVPDRAISLEQLIEEAKDDEKPYLLVGDGAEMCYNTFLESGVVAILAPENQRFQSAYGVCMAAMNMTPTEAYDMEPNYLRLSQAERERLEKLAGENTAG